METQAKCLLLLFSALILKNCVLMLPGFWDAVLRGRHKCLSSNNAGVGSGHSAGWVLAEKVAGVGGIPCGSSNLERKQGLFPAVDY